MSMPGADGNVYVVCEGSFMNGNATLFDYQPATDSVFGDLYSSANSQALGDVFQSMTKIGTQFFLCINNSDKVVIVNADNRVLSGIINIPKPRYVLPINTTKAYVSSEYSKNVYIINTQTLAVTDTIKFPFQNTEGMCLYGNYAFVCTWDTACNVIYKVDVTTDRIVQTIKISGYAPQEAVLDKEGMLWVLSGQQPKGWTAALTRIDPSSGDVLVAYPFNADADAIKPVFNNTKDTLYFIEADYNGGTVNNGIYRMGIHDATLPTTAFVAAKQLQYFYALGIDPLTGYIYVGDPKGFVQKGSVYIYGQDGLQLKGFNVGIGPGHFYFDE